MKGAFPAAVHSLPGSGDTFSKPEQGSKTWIKARVWILKDGVRPWIVSMPRALPGLPGTKVFFCPALIPVTLLNALEFLKILVHIIRPHVQGKTLVISVLAIRNRAFLFFGLGLLFNLDLA